MSLPHSQLSLHLIVNGCMQRRLIYKPELGHEYWRFFTYMLLHADTWHLWINMCLQVGWPTEPLQMHSGLMFTILSFAFPFFLASALLVSGWNWSRVIGVWAWSTLRAAYAAHWPMPGCSRSCHCWAHRRASMPCCAVMCRTWFWSVNCV